MAAHRCTALAAEDVVLEILPVALEQAVARAAVQTHIQLAAVVQVAQRPQAQAPMAPAAVRAISVAERAVAAVVALTRQGQPEARAAMAGIRAVVAEAEVPALLAPAARVERVVVATCL